MYILRDIRLITWYERKYCWASHASPLRSRAASLAARMDAGQLRMLDVSPPRVRVIGLCTLLGLALGPLHYQSASFQHIAAMTRRCNRRVDTAPSASGRKSRTALALLPSSCALQRQGGASDHPGVTTKITGTCTPAIKGSSSACAVWDRWLRHNGMHGRAPAIVALTQDIDASCQTAFGCARRAAPALSRILGLITGTRSAVFRRVELLIDDANVRVHSAAAAEPRRKCGIHIFCQSEGSLPALAVILVRIFVDGLKLAPSLD